MTQEICNAAEGETSTHTWFAWLLGVHASAWLLGSSLMPLGGFAAAIGVGMLGPEFSEAPVSAAERTEYLREREFNWWSAYAAGAMMVAIGALVLCRATQLIVRRPTRLAVVLLGCVYVWYWQVVGALVAGPAFRNG